MILLVAVLDTCTGVMPFEEQCLYWHNYFRKLHQVPAVTWSKKLQKEAQDWANYLAKNNMFKHSSKNPGNLYLSAYKPREYCSDAIWWFHREEKFYNYSNPRYVKAAGHFTQLVWKNSKQIGAAFKIRKDNRLVVSIKYHPGGNYIGYFKKNVLPPTASLLGPEWTRVPPKFARCPILTPTDESVPDNNNITHPYVHGSAGIVAFTLELLTGSFILATLIW